MSSKSVHSASEASFVQTPTAGAGSVLQRMMQITGAATQTELAAHLEVGKAAISDAKRRNMVPAEWFLKLCRAPHYANVLWLETGQAPERMPQPPALAEAAPEYGLHVCKDAYHNVPLARLRLQEGGGLEVSPDAARFMFHTQWLERRGDPESMKLLRIMGHAMSPTLRDGDMVLLDESQRDVYEGSVYVLGMDGQVVVKRLAKRLGSVLLISENRELYEPQEVPFPNKGLQVVGRVVWLSREL